MLHKKKVAELARRLAREPKKGPKRHAAAACSSIIENINNFQHISIS